MRNKTLVITIAVILLSPKVNFGQSPPDLGDASGFALFSAAGAFDVLGASTVVTGDVGTNVGAFNGFPPGTVIGQIHVADAVTAAAAPDVLTAYAYLDAITCGLVLGTPMGGGQLLTPNVYCLGAASTLNGDLTLDGQGDANSIFIFQVDGAFATGTLSNVYLTNGASLCNVFWQINGAFSLGEGSVFRGTILNTGAIHLLEGSSLLGSALSTAGAIDLHNNIVTMGTQAAAPVIIADGPTTFCTVDSVILSGNTGGTWSTGADSESITVKTSGDYYVTNTTNCGSAISNHIIVSTIDCGGGVLVPVATWALILGGIMIAVFAFIRYRRFI
jgi:hypothetical protein